MPNKRADNKDYLSAWIDADLKTALRKLAKERGTSMSDIINDVLCEEVEKYEAMEDKDGSK
ncbi:MAG: ribbon-helix-helix protein, CopG family [Kiritimatiellales bacterium]